jgi:hypothetical protein
MPSTTYLLPHLDEVEIAFDRNAWTGRPEDPSRDYQARLRRTEYLARLLESIPGDWSDVSGLLEAPEPSALRGEVPAPNTGYRLHRFDAEVRVVARQIVPRIGEVTEVARPDLFALVVEGRPPSFVSFRETGYGDPDRFRAAHRIASGLVRRGYTGHLALNNGHARKYTHEKPAEVELHLAPWERVVDGQRRMTPPAVVLQWDEAYGGSAAQLAPVSAACRLACLLCRD